MSDIERQPRSKSGSSIGDAEPTFLDYIATVWRYRWLVVGLWLVTVLATFAVTLKSPRIYESTATLLAPRESAGIGLLGGLVATGLVSTLPGLPPLPVAPNRDMLISILKSRTVAQAVTARFQLQKRFRTQYLEDAILRLQNATSISASKEGMIAVKVEDRDPHLAAEMANFYVEQLDRLVTYYGTGEAGRQRGFITEQLARAKGQLESAEQGLRAFQERNRAIVLQEQTRGAIEAAARLKGAIMAAEVQLQVMRNFATDANPEIVAVKRRVEEMKRQLTEMQYGDGVSRSPAPEASRGGRDFNVPFARVPEIGLELARLTRDVKVQETLVTLLTQQLEQAKIAEARDIPTVQVLDRAVPGERPSRPNLRLNLLLAAFTSLFVGVMLTVFVDHLRIFRERRHHL